MEGKEEKWELAEVKLSAGAYPEPEVTDQEYATSPGSISKYGWEGCSPTNNPRIVLWISGLVASSSKKTVMPPKPVIIIIFLRL